MEFNSFKMDDYDFFIGFALEVGGRFVDELRPDVGRIYASPLTAR